jgi:hypothetical protein
MYQSAINKLLPICKEFGLVMSLAAKLVRAVSYDDMIGYA